MYVLFLEVKEIKKIIIEIIRVIFDDYAVQVHMHTG